MSEPSVDELKARLAKLEAEVSELDERNLMLEREIARRGVKLSCANIALARAKIAFDELSRHREEAFQDIAHDLKTPLTSIKGAARNVLDGIAGPIGDDVREYVEIMHEQSDRLVTVVNWLVQAIRITAEQRELEDTESDLGVLVERAVAGLRPIAQARDIELRVEAPSVPMRVDRAKIRQVLDNLVGNALKFTPSGGHVKVTVTSDSARARISVEDDGEGMSEEALERIFHRYYRARPDTEGSGLGLLIAQELVRLHGGLIHVKSTLGAGTTFVVELPRSGPPTQPAVADSSVSAS